MILQISVLELKIVQTIDINITSLNCCGLKYFQSNFLGGGGQRGMALRFELSWNLNMIMNIHVNTCFFTYNMSFKYNTILHAYNTAAYSKSKYLHHFVYRLLSELITPRRTSSPLVYSTVYVNIGLEVDSIMTDSRSARLQ